MPTVNNLTASQVASSKPEAIQSTDSTPAARATGQALRRRATSLKVQVENAKLTDSQRASGKAVSKLPSDNQQASCATDSQPIYVNWVQTPRWPTVMCQTNLVTSVNQTDSRRTSSELKGRSRQVADSQVTNSNPTAWQVTRSTRRWQPGDNQQAYRQMCR